MSSPSAQPTMQDIADEAGVGKATVSLALRDDPRLRLDTRRRIQKLAAKMGYRTNAVVANLMAQLRASRAPKYQATLGLLNASIYPDALSGLHTFRDWVSGCVSRAAHLGYQLDQFWLQQPGLSAQRLMKILQSRNIRGLVVAALLDSNTLPHEFHALWSRFACVVIGIRPTEPTLHSASNDQYTTTLRAVQELIRRGCERPALVIDPKLDELVERRFSAGFWAGQLALDPARRVPIFPFDERNENGFGKWLREHRPDAILTLHCAVKTWIEKAGKKNPLDVGLAHLDRTADLQNWAGMRQNNELVGAAAVDLAIGQLHRNELGLPEFPKSILIESTWIDGATLDVRGRKPEVKDQKSENARLAR